MSSASVESVIEQKTVQPAWAGTDDPWEAFRQVEIITLELTQQYRHSLGKYSRFFIELANKQFYGTRCSNCERVYTPPRPLCPDCLHITGWTRLPGTGALMTYAVMHFASEVNDDVRRMSMPIILAYVLLDGSSTLFPHLLKADPQAVHTGMRVQVAYADAPVQHPIHLMHFVASEA
ncbi:MAG: hypothetical protein GYB67_05070 [Chloroflexi bacterium]|nr:hypothetical protein [Chloroflexota bacterium]